MRKLHDVRAVGQLARQTQGTIDQADTYRQRVSAIPPVTELAEIRVVKEGYV